MLLWLALLAVIPIIGGYYLTRGKAKSLDRLQDQVEGDVRRRLESIAAAVGGRVIDGPALETPRGQMALLASKAPASMVIDLARFSARTALEGALTVVRVEDARKIIATKNLRPVPLKDPAIAQRYVALASDETQGARRVSPAFTEKLQALETSARARCRLQVAHGLITIQAFRGMAKPEELKAFYEGSLAAVDALEAADRPPA
jgi:hypothetical protein